MTHTPQARSQKTSVSRVMPRGSVAVEGAAASSSSSGPALGGPSPVSSALEVEDPVGVDQLETKISSLEEELAALGCVGLEEG